ncbi:MAG: hypothetical protein AAGF48_13065 [Pseudomonadota bacterium]
MGEVKIPYYVVPPGRKNGYWRPNKYMRELGFVTVPCGPDGPEAWRIAESWNAKWQAVRAGNALPPTATTDLSIEDAENLTIYPEGSIGAGFRRYRNSQPWRDKKPRTQENWWRGWRHIKPVFGDVDPNTIQPEHLEEWRAQILARYSLHEAWLATKTWRALWKPLASYGLCQKDSDPSSNLRNTAPKGRTAIFTEGEAVRRIKRAIRMDYHGLACIMAVAWDTQFSPVDCRTLAPEHQGWDDDGMFFLKYREKTKDVDESAVEAVGTLSKRSERLIVAYLESLPIEIMPDAPLFRNRSGRPYTKDTLSRDFRAVRDVEAPGDDRKLMDFRRSGAVEATAGDVDPLQLSQKMANSIDQSKRLQDTYIPKRAALVRLADEARKRGRRELRGNKRG